MCSRLGKSLLVNGLVNEWDGFWYGWFTKPAFFSGIFGELWHFQCRTFGRSVTSPNDLNLSLIMIYVVMVLLTSASFHFC